MPRYSVTNTATLSLSLPVISSTMATLSGRGVVVVVMCAYLLSLQLGVLASDANTDEERTNRQ
jgi:hypothetical protein